MAIDLCFLVIIGMIFILIEKATNRQQKLADLHRELSMAKRRKDELEREQGISNRE